MQLAATIAIIALAGTYLARSLRRTFSAKKPGCGSGCGKCAAPVMPESKGRFPLPQT